MSDDTPTPNDGAPETTAPGADAPAEAKAEKTAMTDEEKAAKIAAAKAKVAAKKAAEAAAAGPTEEAPPKPPWEEKPVPPIHEDAADDPDVAALKDALGDAVIAADTFAGDVTVTVTADTIREACSYLKAERGYTFLVDLTAVDYPEREEGRFSVVYWMHRFDDSKRLRLATVVAEDQGLASVVSVWKTANWMEREVFDMFGIVFEGHPGLERILTWEGFNGHPLRKDFPVEGIDTGAAIYPDVYPPGGGPLTDEEKGGTA